MALLAKIYAAATTDDARVVLMIDRITIRITPDIAEALERFIAEEMGPPASRQDAFRHILRDWLISTGYLKNSPDREDAN